MILDVIALPHFRSKQGLWFFQTSIWAKENHELLSKCETSFHLEVFVCPKVRLVHRIGLASFLEGLLLGSHVRPALWLTQTLSLLTRIYPKLSELRATNSKENHSAFLLDELRRRRVQWRISLELRSDFLLGL
jgi:hypothetical protein